MKAKVVGLRVLVMHIVVLAMFSMMQGCTTGDAPVRWLNWPYSTPKDQPVVLPAGPEITSMGILPAVAPSEKVHSVQKGETLSSIGSSYGVSWKKLAEYNGLSNPNQLKVGQEIRIPDSFAAAPASSSKVAAPVSSRPSASAIKQGSSYTIQKGDSLSTIAKRSGLTVSEIKTANSLKSDSIVAGKKLSIPKKGAVAAPAVAKVTSVKTTNAVPVKAAAADSTLPAAAPMVDVAAPATVAPAVVPAAAAPEAKAASAPVYEHVLYPGETLDDVARQYGSSQQEIMKLNNITDPTSIKPGTKLLVPIPE